MNVSEIIQKPIAQNCINGETPEACEEGEPLEDITELSPRIHFQAHYYKRHLRGALSRCYVRFAVKEKLLQILEELPEEYGFLVFDALRPVDVQQALYTDFWNQLRRRRPDWDERRIAEEIDQFVAFPRVDYRRPAPHMTGGAIDLTLTYKGTVLPMGTEFDDFSIKASTRYFEENAVSEEEHQAKQNRRLLYYVMTKAGFVNYSEEWWHYSYGDRAWAGQTGGIPVYSHIEAP